MQIVGIKVAPIFNLNRLSKWIYMENGEYYMVVGTEEDPNSPRLILGYTIYGQRVEIYKNLETYTVFNTKTEKYLTCLGLEHARYVFMECVRTLATEAKA